jgi:hypothetical protein
MKAVDTLNGGTIIHGVRTADIDRLKKAGPWVNIMDLAGRLLRDHAHRLRRAIALKTNVPGEVFEPLTAFRYPEDSAFGAFARLYRSMQACAPHQDRINAVRKLSHLFPDIPIAGAAEDFLAAYEAVMTTYPLFYEWDYRSKERLEDWHAYIALVDAKVAADAGKPKRSRGKSKKVELKLTGT